MRRLPIIIALAALACFDPSAAFGRQAQTQTASAPARAAQQHLIGEVTALDAATGQLTVKPDGGEVSVVTTDAKTAYKRIPPGETALSKAELITRADVQVGDRVLVPNGVSAGPGVAAKQVIVMARAAITQQREREREERQRRSLNGRVTAVDAAKKEITVQARSRDGMQAVTVAVGDSTRLLRYAPDSLRTADARPGSFADVRAGDQIRATGDRDAAGTRFTAEEVITGSVARVFGQVASVDAARNELTVKNEQSGQVITVALGKNTTVRRVPEEFAAQLAERRRQMQERRAQRGDGQAGGQPGGQPGAQGGGNREGRRGEGGGRGPGQGGQRGGGGGGQMFENFPTITIAELKKGDIVMVTGTTGAEPTRLTAVTLVTGTADVLRMMMGGQRGGERNMSPGLPGDVMGGGTGGSREPPRN